MLSDPSRRDRINSFAIVTYVPEPLASFLHGLAGELAPESRHRAHLTILPPRPLTAAPDDAWRYIRSLAPGFRCFDIELTEVRVFPISGVVYLDVGAGADELREMHAVFNSRALAGRELFEFCPHLTLAQDTGRHDVEQMAEIARRRWNEFAGDRRFRVESVTFVENTLANEWLDLGECRLGAGEMQLLEPLVAR